MESPRIRADRRDKRPIPHTLRKDGTEAQTGFLWSFFLRHSASVRTAG